MTTRQNIKQELPEKDYIYNLFKDQLQKEYWNLNRTNKSGKPGGHERVSVVTKKAQCIKQRHGSYDPYPCDECGIMLNVVISGFIRDKQKSNDTVYFVFDVTEGKAYTLNENPRRKDFKGSIPLMTEWDHYNRKDKTIENSRLWKSLSIQKAYSYFLKTRALCVECHRKKNSDEERRKSNRLLFDECIDILVNTVKPKNKPDFKNALNKAKMKALDEFDMNLLHKLERIPGNPIATYGSRFKWQFVKDEVARKNNG